MRRIAMLSGLVLVGGLLGPSNAFASQGDEADDDKIRWVAVEDDFAFVLPDGETFTGQDEPGPELPPVGSRLFLSEALFATEDGETPGDEVGNTHIQCTVQIVQTTFFCDIAFVLNEGSQLLGSAVVDFSGPEGESLSFDIPVTGGSDEFFGAAGVVTLTDISAAPDEAVTLYEVDVELARDKGPSDD